MKASEPSKVLTDWAAFDAMTEEEVHAAALSDPDAQPLTPEQLARMRPGYLNTRLLRHRLKLTQEQFADQFRIPLATIRDWEERRSEPDAVASAYLRAINFETEAVRRACATKSPPLAAAAE
jgi:putative transcriptional regulator